MALTIQEIIDKLSKFNSTATVKDYDDTDYEISDIVYDEDEDEIYVEFE